MAFLHEREPHAYTKDKITLFAVKVLACYAFAPSTCYVMLTLVCQQDQDNMLRGVKDSECNVQRS